MRRKFLPLVMLLSTLFMASSCLNDDEATVTYYDDTAITSFSLGTLNRYLHTKKTVPNADGVYEDSIYKTTLNASSYKFYIDQLRCRIYNVDSLPVGTDVSKVVCTINAKNGGVVFLNPKTADGQSDSLVYYVSTDSIDFTDSQEVRVYNTRGSDFRAYTVEVRVHQEAAETFSWERMSEVPARVSAQLAQRQATLARQEWLAGPFNDAREWLPTEDLNCVTVPLRVNVKDSLRILVGNRSLTAYADEAYAIAWGRLIEETPTQEPAWTLYSDHQQARQLPRMKGLQVVVYDGTLLAVGGKGVGGCADEPFASFYRSYNWGLAWQKDTVFQLPDEFDKSSEVFSLVADEDNYLWLICEDSGQVWRGRINRLGWKEED